MDIITKSIRIRATRHIEWTEDAVKSAAFHVRSDSDRPNALWIVSASTHEQAGDRVIIAVELEDIGIGPFIAATDTRFFVAANDLVAAFDIESKHALWRHSTPVCVYGIEPINGDLLVVDEICIALLGPKGEDRWTVATTDAVSDYTIELESNSLLVRFMTEPPIRIDLSSGKALK